MRHESRAETIARALLERYGLEGALAVVHTFLDSCSIVELAAHEADWVEFWARPEQLPPASDWSTFSFLAGRGFGKTVAASRYVNGEIRAGRARSVCILAQNEDNTIKLQVEGPSGLIATAPPDFKPIWASSDKQLNYPNGAVVYVRTPEVPGAIRGFDYHITWATELQSWPATSRDEAWMNVRIATRLGYSRIVTDSTPKRRNPLQRQIIRDAERDPARHVLVRGATHRNVYLSRSYIAEIEAGIGGTQRGREELLGEYLDDVEGALVRQEWIDRARRPRPDQLTRVAIGIDPAITSRVRNDRTGIVVAGLGVDGQAYVLADHTSRYTPAGWASVVLDRYVAESADCVVVETNKGGELVSQNLRAHADRRGLSVVVLGKEERPRHVPGIVYVREVYARGPKEDRAQPLATAYERGKVSHVIGAELEALEETLTTWEPTPGQRSPDALDAEVHAVTELLGLTSNAPDPRAGFAGIQQATEALKAPPSNVTANLSRLLGGNTRTGRI